MLGASPRDDDDGDSSRPSLLGAAPWAHEIAIEQKIRELLEEWNGTLHDANLTRAALEQAKLDAPLDLNPYRPARGEQLKDRIFRSQVAIWATDIGGEGLTVTGTALRPPASTTTQGQLLEQAGRHALTCPLPATLLRLQRHGLRGASAFDDDPSVGGPGSVDAEEVLAIHPQPRVESAAPPVGPASPLEEALFEAAWNDWVVPRLVARMQRGECSDRGP